jgi:hypothetical protein
MYYEKAYCRCLYLGLKEGKGPGKTPPLVFGAREQAALATTLHGGGVVAVVWRTWCGEGGEGAGTTSRRHGGGQHSVEGVQHRRRSMEKGGSTA